MSNIKSLLCGYNPAGTKREILKIRSFVQQKSLQDDIEELFEEISEELYASGDLLRSFEFYVLAGRFNIQHILNRYFISIIEQARISTSREYAGVLLSASCKKIIAS